MGFYWYLKTGFSYFVFGTEGLINCIQMMPMPFIIPNLRRYGAEVGENNQIHRGLIIHDAGRENPFKKLKIGDGVYIGRNVLLDIREEIIIENNVAFGANCNIWTHVGDYSKQLYNGDYTEKKGSVTIKQSTICYSGTIIGHSLCIGPFSRIGAGSVVLRDVPPYSLFGGVPAKFIKNISQKNEK